MRSGYLATTIVILTLMAVVVACESDEPTDAPPTATLESTSEPTSTPEPTAAPTQAADVLTVTVVADDHGDDLASATPVTIGDTVDDAIEYTDDYDYFAFTVVEASASA